MDEAAAGTAAASLLVGRGGVEPPTFHFSGGRSYQLSYLPERGETLPEPDRGHESRCPTTNAYAVVRSPAPIV